MLETKKTRDIIDVDDYTNYNKKWTSNESIKECEIKEFLVCELDYRVDVSKSHCNQASCEVCPNCIKKKFYLVPKEQVP